MTLIVGFLTYVDILIRMNSKKYFFRSIWGILEIIIAVLLTTIIFNLIFRGFRL